MPEIEACGDRYRGRAKNLEFGEYPLVPETKSGDDRGCNTEAIQWNLVFVRFLVTVQETAGSLK